MCRRLMLSACAALTLIGPGAHAGGNPEDDDRFAGEVLFGLAEALHKNRDAPTGLRTLLGSSIELAFLALERSDSPAALDALARSALLRLDAGGGQVRTAAIIDKGQGIDAVLADVIEKEYERVCRGAVVDVCMTRDEATRYIAELRAALSGHLGVRARE